MNIKISALQFTREIKSGNISAEDFIAKTMEQIKKIDGNLHAFLSLNEKAVDQAKEIDKNACRLSSTFCICSIVFAMKSSAEIFPDFTSLVNCRAEIFMFN